MTVTAAKVEAEALTERQREVLEAALRLLVDAGESLTMSAVAQRASCSKETLYKWFGGRDGLLTATVQWQASRVRAVPLPATGLDLATLKTSLEGFARDWLTVLTGETSVALNRLAVGNAVRARGETDGPPLGAIVLENGPLAMRRRLGPLLEAGRKARLLEFDDTDDAFATFFGLVVRDVQIRLLLGDTARFVGEGISSNAERAVAQFLTLHAAPDPALGGPRGPQGPKPTRTP